MFDDSSLVQRQTHDEACNRAGFTLIISRTPPDFLKAHTDIKANRALIVLGHLKKERCGPARQCAHNDLLHKPFADPLATKGFGDRDGQNFSLISDNAGQHKTRKRLPLAGLP